MATWRLWSLCCVFFVIQPLLAQQLPQLCAQIDQFTACTTAARQRVDACSKNITTVVNLAFYECQCTELTSIATCYTYCPDSPDIQLQLPNEKANAQAWCDQASSMKAAQPTTTTSKSISSTSVIATTTKPPASITSSPSIITPTSSPSSATNSGSLDATLTSSKAPGATSTLDFSGSGRSIQQPLGWIFQIFLGLFIIVAMGLIN